MLTQIINGHILTPSGWLKDGSVIVCDGKIMEVTNSDLAVIGAGIVDAKGMYIVPGFVSIHAHGAAGHDYTEATRTAFETATAAHARHGATSQLATISASPFDTIRDAVKACEETMAAGNPYLMGLHIEGPYLNRNMAGKQWGDCLKDPDPQEYRPLLEATHCIRRWDISPELPGAHDFGRYVSGQGILTSITHTEAEYHDIREAYECGFTHAAHFYNAMPGFHKRREYKYEGTVESVYLVSDMTAEIIADGRHLPATILKLVYKLKGAGRTCLATDAMKYACCTSDEIDDPRYVVEDGVCKLADHQTIIGSIATIDTLVANMVKLAGVPLADAVRMASETPARLIGIDDRKGTLQKGKDADIVILDRDINVRCVFSHGEIVDGTDTLIH